MLYCQLLFYIGSFLLLSYHYLQLIPDICRTGLVLGTSSQFAILLICNFSSCILGILFSDYLQLAHIVSHPINTPSGKSVFRISNYSRSIINSETLILFDEKCKLQ